MTRDIFPALVSNIASNVALFTINKFQRRIKGKGAVRGEKGSTVIYCNKSLEDLGVLIDGVAESVKHEIKKKTRWISWWCIATLGCFIGTTCDLFSGERCYLEEGSKEQQKDIWLKFFSSTPFFMQY